MESDSESDSEEMVIGPHKLKFKSKKKTLPGHSPAISSLPIQSSFYNPEIEYNEIPVICISPFAYWVSFYDSYMFKPHNPFPSQKFTANIPIRRLVSTEENKDYMTIRVGLYMADYDLQYIREIEKECCILKSDVINYINKTDTSPKNLYFLDFDKNIIETPQEHEPDNFAINENGIKKMSKLQLLFLLGRQRLVNCSVVNNTQHRLQLELVPETVILDKSGSFSNATMISVPVKVLYECEDEDKLEFPVKCTLNEKEDVKADYCLIRFEKKLVFNQIYNRNTFSRSNVLFF